LSKGRLIAFVVSEAPITVHIDDHVALEFVAKIESEPNHLSHCLGIFAVDMENRNLEHLGHIRGIGAGSAFAWRSRETDLIIHNDMQRPADAVSC
jgi:hypothetical protein